MGLQRFYRRIFRGQFSGVYEGPPLMFANLYMACVRLWPVSPPEPAENSENEAPLNHPVVSLMYSWIL